MGTAVGSYQECLEDARSMINDQGYSLDEVRSQLEHDEVPREWIGSIIGTLKQEQAQKVVRPKVQKRR